MRPYVYVFALSACLAPMASAQALPEGVVPTAQPVAANQDLPPVPRGKSTVMGGEIEKVDMVRDQLVLKVPPTRHSIKILFDERTQVFQNGKPISMLQLHPEDHASIETNLDGTSIFALRIHLLSELPDGELHGRVERYNASTGELRLLLNNTKDAVTVTADAGTPIARVGQPGFTAQRGGAADLVPGTLVDVNFKSAKGKPGAATKINVLAVPGSEFIFHGNLTSLDLRAGRLSVQGDSDRPTDISFEPARFEVAHDLHPGTAVTVKARFDGTRYTASNITVE